MSGKVLYRFRKPPPLKKENRVFVTTIGKSIATVNILIICLGCLFEIVFLTNVMEGIVQITRYKRLRPAYIDIEIKTRWSVSPFQ